MLKGVRHDDVPQKVRLISLFRLFFKQVSWPMEENAPLPSSTFRCKQCRNTLFSTEDIEGHQVALHQLRYARGAQTGRSRCTSHFLEQPQSWMDLTGATSGKLYCPHCSSKIGSFDWSGSQCSCGTWVSPSIQILHSKVDEERNQEHEEEHENEKEQEHEKEHEHI